MIRIHETPRVLPFFPPVPLTRLPLLYHREHLFPYTSYGDTQVTAESRAFRMSTCARCLTIHPASIRWIHDHANWS